MAVEGNPGGDPNDAGRSSNPNDSRGFGGNVDDAQAEANMVAYESWANENPLAAQLFGMFMGTTWGGMRNAGLWGAMGPQGRMGGDRSATQGIMDAIANAVGGTSSGASRATAMPSRAASEGGRALSPPGGQSVDPMSLIFGDGAGSGSGMSPDIARISSSRMPGRSAPPMPTRDPGAPPPGMIGDILSPIMGAVSQVRNRPQPTPQASNDTLMAHGGNLQSLLARLVGHGDVTDPGAIGAALEPTVAKGRDLATQLSSYGATLPDDLLDTTDLAARIGGLQGSQNADARMMNNIARARSGGRF